MNAQMFVCECANVSVCVCEYTCQCAFVNGCVSVHKCVIACVHTSDYALAAEGAELFSWCAVQDGLPVLPGLVALLELPGPWEAASQSG